MSDTSSEAIIPVTSSVRFTGTNTSFRNLIVRGGFLGFFTAGFYRFWLVTDVRRHLWLHTEVDGDSFEYTGRPKELLLGALMALAILLPVTITSFIMGLYFERWKAFSSIPLYLFYFVFGQWAAYRAVRYRLSRTVWRGVRFWMTGSAWGYAMRSFLWFLVAVLTLGFAYPWRMAALERYKLRHTRYGNAQAAFVGTGWELFRRVWLIWLVGLTPLLAILGLTTLSVLIAFRSLTADSNFTAIAAILPFCIFLFMPVIPFLQCHAQGAGMDMVAEQSAPQ